MGFSMWPDQQPGCLTPQIITPSEYHPEGVCIRVARKGVPTSLAWSLRGDQLAITVRKYCIKFKKPPPETGAYEECPGLVCLLQASALELTAVRWHDPGGKWERPVWSQDGERLLLTHGDELELLERRAEGWRFARALGMPSPVRWAPWSVEAVCMGMAGDGIYRISMDRLRPCAVAPILEFQWRPGGLAEVEWCEPGQSILVRGSQEGPLTRAGRDEWFRVDCHSGRASRFLQIPPEICSLSRAWGRPLFAGVHPIPSPIGTGLTHRLAMVDVEQGKRYNSVDIAYAGYGLALSPDASQVAFVDTRRRVHILPCPKAMS